jgi:hypothetical protein
MWSPDVYLPDMEVRVAKAERKSGCGHLDLEPRLAISVHWSNEAGRALHRSGSVGPALALLE